MPSTMRLPDGPWRLLLKLLLLAAGLVLTNHFVAARIGYFVRFELHFPLAVFLGIWATAIASLLYIAFTPQPGVRIFWVALVGLSTVAGEVYFQVVADRMTIDALDAMWHPAMVNAETVAFYGRETLLAVLGTAVLLTGLGIPPPRLGVSMRREWMLLPALPCLLSAGLIWYVGASSGLETRGLPSQFHNLSLFTIYALNPTPDQAKADIEILPVHRRSAKHVVLIVDESVSGDFIDLNVPRGTTPYLASEPEGLVNFGLATAAGNCSNSSNALLRLGAKPERLGTTGYSPLSNPSVWKYAAAAGFETNYVEAYDVAESGQNFMNRTEVELIGHVLSVPIDVPAPFRDAEVTRLLLEVLERPNPQFVYVNKEGAHFPYHRVLREGDARFLPAMQPLERIADRERLVNSYKNAIYRSVDLFFEGLLPQIEWDDTVVLYTSDHGQNLLDDGAPGTHCRRIGQSLHEAVVPLLAWAGNDRLRRRLQRAASMNFGAASHFEIFPTLLVLFGYDPAFARETYHGSLFEKIAQPLGYVSGPITGRLGRKPVWNSRARIDRLGR